jgi:hypothetical protein
LERRLLIIKNKTALVEGLPRRFPCPPSEHQIIGKYDNSTIPSRVPAQAGPGFGLTEANPDLDCVTFLDPDGPAATGASDERNPERDR